MHILSLVWGILAALGMLVAFFPCLGSLNWLNIPFAGLGFIISLVTVLTTASKSKGSATAGLVLCAIAMLFGIFRLVIGGGVV